MSKVFIVTMSIFVSALTAFFVVILMQERQSEIPAVLSTEATPEPTPLARYGVENLSTSRIQEGNIQIKEPLTEEQEFTSYIFEHTFKPALDGEEKMTTGMLNIPTTGQRFPAVVMVRGYVDQSIYETGIGTKNASYFFAENGFITVAPDFLGYADSSSESSNIFETRFQTYTTLMSILRALRSIPEWDREHLFIWAHSNGGQIALTTLAATGRAYPTTLWAPVTKPFPYSVLYYTDESIDGGKFIRSELAKFESLYDVDDFSFRNFLDRIEAPIQLHQGNADDAIPQAWSDEFVSEMQSLEKDIEYYVYTGADHNLRPDWNTVVMRDLEFFKSHMTGENE